MKERTLKELYQIILDNWELLSTERAGICYAIISANRESLINGEEYDKLMKDFNKRKPNIFSRFWWKWSFNKVIPDYWWDLTKKGHEQRKLFLQHIINKL